MPGGAPLAYMGENEAGAKNAGIEAVRILADSDPHLAERYQNYINDMARKVMNASVQLLDLGPTEYLERNQ